MYCTLGLPNFDQKCASLRCFCRALLLAGDYFVGGVLAAALTKLHIRLRKLTGDRGNQGTAQSMALIAGIVLVGQDSRTQQMDADSRDSLSFPPFPPF